LDLKNALEANAMATEEDKSRPRLVSHAKDGILNLHIDILTLHRESQTLGSLETTAEIQMVKRPFGATPLIRERDGSIATQLAGNHHTSLDVRNVLETNVLAIEEDKSELDQERPARDGIDNLLIDMQTLLRRNQTLGFMLTTAETQMVRQLFGATLLIEKRDGNSVTQSALNLTTRVKIRESVCGTADNSTSSPNFHSAEC
jgi:hypothetical protein